MDLESRSRCSYAVGETDPTGLVNRELCEQIADCEDQDHP